MNRARIQELIEQRMSQRKGLYQVTLQDATHFTLNGHPYLLKENYRKAFNGDSLADRFSPLLTKYDYIVGDWGYDQLRLRGFYAKPGQGEEEQGVGCINDYLMEECNFGCPYFIIQNLEVAHPKRPRKPRTRRRGRAEISEEKKPLKEPALSKRRHQEVRRVKGKGNRTKLVVRTRKDD
ncbi:YutD family protein [Limosilactobacillus fermentum]|uniref:YutD family protein n=1 Tax=Limosilactobacillus fermentum TaxID=1613 RepID=UPI0031651EBC